MNTPKKKKKTKAKKSHLQNDPSPRPFDIYEMNFNQEIVWENDEKEALPSPSPSPSPDDEPDEKEMVSAMNATTNDAATTLYIKRVFHAAEPIDWRGDGGDGHNIDDNADEKDLIDMKIFEELEGKYYDGKNRNNRHEKSYRSLLFELCQCVCHRRRYKRREVWHSKSLQARLNGWKGWKQPTLRSLVMDVKQMLGDGDGDGDGDGVVSRNNVEDLVIQEMRREHYLWEDEIQNEFCKALYEERFNNGTQQ